MSVGPNRIIGFARVNLARNPCPAGRGAGPNTPFTATITRQPSTVAPFNATAMLSAGLITGLPPALLGELLDKNLSRTGVNYGPVLVAVLAR